MISAEIGKCDPAPTVVLEKTLESQIILREISPKCSSEGLMLKLKLQYFGHLM